MTDNYDEYWIDPDEPAGGTLVETEDTQWNELLDELVQELVAEFGAGVDPEAVVEELEAMIPTDKKSLGEHSLIYFIKEYLSAATQAFADVHYDVSRLLQDPRPGKRILLLFPREHAKTTIITFSYVLWCICYNKKRNIVICSDSKNQAQEFLRNIKTELETNQKIIEDFGDLVPTGQHVYDDNKRAMRGKWDERHVITRNQVQIKCLSPGSQARGLNFNVYMEDPDNPGQMITKPQRPDLLICDDILNDKWIKNRVQRDKIEEWFFSPVFNAVDSDIGDIIVVGTILHHDDLLSRIYKDEERTAGWVKMKRPACSFDPQTGEIGNVLWPGRWSAAKLLHRRREIGSLAFAREFLLNPTDEGAQFFNHAWFEFYVDKQSVPVEWWDGLVVQGLKFMPNDLLCVTSIDPAISEKDVADYSVVMTMGFSPSTRSYYVLDCFRERCSPEKQVKEMIRQGKRWDRTRHKDGYGHIGYVIETYAYQASIKYWLKKFLKENDDFNHRLFERAEQRADKATRVSMVSPVAEQRRLYFPVACKLDEADRQKKLYHPFSWLQDELNDFPMGAYDDGVDALQRCYSALIREERRYALMGAYGPEGIASMEAMMQSFNVIKEYI